MADDVAQAGRFDLDEFLPYLLNQSAEAVSDAFQECYRETFSLTRTQWRVMAHLDARDGLTAKEICSRTHEDKVSISRGVAALERRGLLSRAPSGHDRRFEVLRLTMEGRQVFAKLAIRAEKFERDLAAKLGPGDVDMLRGLLARILPKLDRDQPGE
jgi:DNA-binding MarR family transcriptional regulator